MTNKDTSVVFSKIIMRCWVFLFALEYVSCYSYPLFGSRRYLRTVPIRRSAYLPIPVTHRNEYQLPDYDDGVIVNSPEEYEYTTYEKYPYVQYYGYYPSKDYYRDKNNRNFGKIEYFGDRVSQDSVDEFPVEMPKEEIYPYGQETWYEEEIPAYDSNAEANAAFVQNLIMAQMYQDAQDQHNLESTADDYDDQHWTYGVPTTEVDEKERVRQYFKNFKEDEEVRELESLARKKNKSKPLKDKASFKKQKNLEIIENPTKPKSKMTDDEYFDMQKQIIVNNRKNSFASQTEGGLDFNKKQKYNPIDMKNGNWDFRNNRNWPSYLESATNSIKKLNVNKNAKGTTELEVSGSKVETSTAAASSTLAPRRPLTVGQKEVVLPRPANPVRRPYPEKSSRSVHQPSVYDTIKKLLNMDKDLQKSESPKLQKRFVLNEDQLTSELSGLKKLSA